MTDVERLVNEESDYVTQKDWETYVQHIEICKKRTSFKQLDIIKYYNLSLKICKTQMMSTVKIYKVIRMIIPTKSPWTECL